MSLALALAFLSGFVALSQEIVWYRVYSFAAGGAADAFPLMLSAYLLGIALGAALVRSLCGEAPSGEQRGALLRATGLLFAASSTAFLIPPAVAALVAMLDTWQTSLPLVVAASAALGAVFPLVSHAAIPPDRRSGAAFSYLYLANIAGSVCGGLGTGFWLLDRLPLARVSLLLALLCLAAGALLLWRALGARRAALPGLALAVAGAGFAALTGPLYGALYEKLQFKSGYRPGERFTHVVENRSGVITVTASGDIYGGGFYDGGFNTTLHSDSNGIVRAYALAGMHAAPREVLMVGLSSGSWATVIAGHPGVESLTLIEINPGYVELLGRYPSVSGLLRQPKVSLEIDDGRRWLIRHPERRFDAVVMNTTANWRANASNLLSVEFTALVRSRLKPGGIYYFNTTGSKRAARTAVEAFRHAISIGNIVAVSDAPLSFDAALWRRAMAGYTLDGRPALDLGRAEERQLLERVAAALSGGLYRPEPVLRSWIGDAALITDDNMGTEWGK